MNTNDILPLSGMPPGHSSDPRGPYRFDERQYVNVVDGSDPAAIRAMVPQPLEPDGSDAVVLEWIVMPGRSGFAAHEECGVVIPCLLDGKPVNQTATVFLIVAPPITAGREICCFPKRGANRLCR